MSEPLKEHRHFDQAEKLKNVFYDIRGPVTATAEKMERDGHTVGALGLTALHPIFLLAIPTLFILLYVMKVGPDSWYTPSLRQLESQRRKEIKMRQLEIESAKAHQQALMRSQRKDQMNQLKSDALDAAQNTLNRFRKP